MNIQDFFFQVPKNIGAGPFQILYGEDANGRVAYMGFAPRGAATSSAVWWIVNLTYFTDGNPASEKTSVTNSIWDNRTSLAYL